jgi:hypothetical protein
MLSRTSLSSLRVSLTALAIALVASATSAQAQVETTRAYDAPVLPERSAASPAEADEPMPTATGAARSGSKLPTEGYWYGWQTASSDAASVAVVLIGSATRASVVTALGVGGTFFGAPGVHLANGRGAIGLASLGLRLALPLLGGFVGYAAAGTCHDDPHATSLFGNCFLHGYSEAAIGGLVGLGSAMVIDASALAYGTREVEPPSPPRERGAPHITSIAPAYDPVTRTAAVGMGGSF